ncbi:MAG: beta-galactosidase, partial [Bacteroidaceae bacterium]|nr:beta-galactosidase [Bacteroidaceae bacterium]
MKRLMAFVAMGLCLSVCAMAGDVIKFNDGWRFHLGDVQNAEAVGFDDSQWRTLDLPHDFQIEQPWVEPDPSERPDNTDAAANIKSRLSSRGFKEMGKGWYRKHYTPAAELKGKRVVLDFEGIMYVGDVYLNGEKIGKTDYGYVGFGIDVSQKLKYGQENVIAVMADTREPGNSRWYTGGGLFRNVHLLVSDSQLYLERHPLYITTKDNREVNVQVAVHSNTRQDVVKVKTVIRDPQGQVVAEQNDDCKRNRRTHSEEFQLKTINIANAQLWDCEHPNLYTAEVTIFDEKGNAVDSYMEAFGIRTVEFSPAFGMKLNGKKLLLKGNANHHTLGALGAAVYPRAEEKRIQLLKAFGYNHIRTSHNPYSKSFLD